MTHANIIASSPTTAATNNDDDYYVVSWPIGKPHLVRVYPHICADGTVDMTVPVAMDAAGLIPYDGSEGPVMDSDEADDVLDSAIDDGPCCPVFESRCKDYQRVTCCYLSNSAKCARRGGCTAAPLPRPIKSGKQTPPVKTDATITTLRRLSRIVDTYLVGRNWTRISESGVYQSAHGTRPTITIQAAPGRVRLTVGGPWMAVHKRHSTPAQRKALQDAWDEGRGEEVKARHDAKEAIRNAYGNNKWQRHLLECAKSCRDLLPRYNPMNAAIQIANVTRRVNVLEQFAKVVDCELSMRYALIVAYLYDAEEAPSHLDDHVEQALQLVAP